MKKASSIAIVGTNYHLQRVTLHSSRRAFVERSWVIANFRPPEPPMPFVPGYRPSGACAKVVCQAIAMPGWSSFAPPSIGRAAAIVHHAPQKAVHSARRHSPCASKHVHTRLNSFGTTAPPKKGLWCREATIALHTDTAVFNGAVSFFFCFATGRPLEDATVPSNCCWLQCVLSCKQPQKRFIGLISNYFQDCFLNVPAPPPPRCCKHNALVTTA